MKRNAMTMTRRDFLALSAAAAAAAGCAINPVTGKYQFMLYSDAEEIEWDRMAAPHQHSTDYGAVQDNSLNEYLSQVGRSLAPLTHRPNMPYNFRVVNSVIVNGYTMPAGSIAMTRGIMLAMNSEAELAAVMGHEMGHVSARHTAARMTWGTAAELSVMVGAALLEKKLKEYTALAAGAGLFGANVLLLRYSREDERQADALGLEYMTKGKYNPQGMADLMNILVSLQKEKPGCIELLFATHPWSGERLKTTQESIRSKYAFASEYPVYRERYMDHTARLRAVSKAIERFQEGETLLLKGKYDNAETSLKEGLRLAPDDYAGLLLMAKCRMVQKKYRDAEGFAEKAKSVYPEEAQANHICGIIKAELSRYDTALLEFDAYERKLPGNPNTIFFKGYCLDKLNRKHEAAEQYRRYLEQDPGGQHAEEVKARLIQWGYITAEPATGSKNR